jgi:hypothetical protein
MADAYICRRGGSGGSGGGGSELVIVGGTTSPTKADHNTIWLNTPNTITSYVLSATEPTNPVEGMAWITIGASGGVKMVAPVGDEWIMVYPISAKQYIDGAWVAVTAKSYQNGAWVDWISYYYNKGDEMVGVTGGWKAVKYYSLGTGSFSKDADGITIFSDSIITISPVKIEKAKIILKATENGVGSGNLYLGTGATADDNFPVVSQTNVTLQPGENIVELDVSSLVGGYYHIFVLLHGNGNVKMTEVYAD